MVSIDICMCMIALKVEDGNEICTHMDNIHHMYEQLAGMNAVPSKDDYMTIILCTLQTTYMNHLFLLSAMAWINNKPLTLHDVRSYVIELYDLCKLQPEMSVKSSKEMTLYTQEKSKWTLMTET